MTEERESMTSRVNRSIIVNTFFTIQQQKVVYWSEVDRKLLTNVNPICLDSGNWDQYKKKFFKQRFLSSPFEHKEEFIQHEKLYLESVKTEDISGNITTTHNVSRFLVLREKYLQFLENEAGLEVVDFGYPTLASSPRLTSREYREGIKRLYLRLNEAKYLKTNLDTFQKAFSGKPTRDYLLIKFNGTQTLIFHLVEWLFQNSIIDSQDRWSVIRKSKIFEYYGKGAWHPVQDIRQYQGNNPPAKFKPLKKILEEVFRGLTKNRK